MRKRITQKAFLTISLFIWNMVSSQSNHLYYHKNPSSVKEGSPVEISQLLFGEEGINSGMLFFRNNGDNYFKYRFESNFNKVVGNLERINSKVTLSTSHTLKVNDIVSLDIDSNLSLIHI